MKVLIVEDEIELAKRLKILFESEGYDCINVESLSELQDLIFKKKTNVDLILLDRMLGGTDAATLIPKIKASYSKINILILSAVDTAIEKAEALNAGADDYLAKPFSSVELLARAKVLMRRISLYNSEIIKVGNVEIKFNEREAHTDNKALNLTHKELALLQLLASTPGKVFSKDLLLEIIWKQNSPLETKVVEVAINKIRKELSSSGATILLKNLRM